MIEISTYSDPNGLGAGLNKGLKVGKFLKKNVRMRNVSLKNAVKVGKFAIPIATSIIPGGAIAGKGLSLLSKAGKVGKFATKIARSKVVQGAVNLSKTATVKDLTGNVNVRDFLPPTTTDYGSQEANYDPPIIQQGGQAIAASSISQIPAPALSTIQQNSFPSSSPTMATTEQLLPVKEVAPPSETAQGVMDNPLNPQPKNNMLLYVGGGIAVLGIIYLATKKSN
jgi:hypothetical protein